MMAASVMVVTLGCLLMPLPHEWSAGWRAEFLNRMHVPLMGVACVVLASIKSAERSSRLQTTLNTALCLILVAALIELLQPWFGRSASTQDFGWGVVGVVGGSLWNWAKATQVYSRQVLMAVLGVLLMLAPPIDWLARVGWEVWQARESFPELLGTHGKRLSFFWVVQPNKEQEALKKRGQILLLSQQDYPATAHLDALGSDWSRHRGLELEGDLESDAAVEIGIRLDLDDANRTKLRTGGWMSPRQKQLQIRWPESVPPKKVRQLVVFLAPETQPARLTLTRLRLIKE
jgi:hypothetical protein